MNADPHPFGRGLKTSCHRCGCAIIWGTWPGYAAHAVDSEPRDDGNLVICGGHRVRYAQPDDTGPRYRSHAAMCGGSTR